MFGSKEEKWRDEEKVRKEKKNERKEGKLCVWYKGWKIQKKKETGNKNVNKIINLS